MSPDVQQYLNAMHGLAARQQALLAEACAALEQALASAPVAPPATAGLAAAMAQVARLAALHRPPGSLARFHAAKLEEVEQTAHALAELDSARSAAKREQAVHQARERASEAESSGRRAGGAIAAALATAAAALATIPVAGTTLTAIAALLAALVRLLAALEERLRQQAQPRPPTSAVHSPLPTLRPQGSRIPG